MRYAACWGQHAPSHSANSHAQAAPRVIGPTGALRHSRPTSLANSFAVTVGAFTAWLPAAVAVCVSAACTAFIIPIESGSGFAQSFATAKGSGAPSLASYELKNPLVPKYC